MDRIWWTCVAALLGLVGHAICAPEIELMPPGATANAYFGSAVAIADGRAVVGAYGDSQCGAYAGAAHVFESSSTGWVWAAKLIGSDIAAYDYFGRAALAVSGDRIVIGADGHDGLGSSSGSAYVFEEIGGVWTQSVKLTAADGYGGDYFGFAVGAESNCIVVGAYGDDDAGSSSGSAYVFEHVDGVWTQTVKLLPGDGARSDEFGRAVAISGDMIVVGARRDDDKGSSSGSAYVFRRVDGVWTQTQKLLASDGAASDSFGCSASISGHYLVVGAYGDDDLGSSSGAAYVFEFTNGVWVQVAKLLAGDGAAYNQFGWLCAVQGTKVIVGVKQSAYGDSSAGAAYVYERTIGGWRQGTKLTASESIAGDQFGGAVDLWGDHAACGSYLASRAASRSGAAYVYDVSDLSNTPPMSSDQTVTVWFAGERYVDLAWDDPDGQRMTVRIVDPPTHGTLESYVARHGSFSRQRRYYYSWTEPFKSDSFSWEVDDGVSTSSVATVTIQGWNSEIAVTGSDWPRWRGSSRDGVSAQRGWLWNWPPKRLWSKSLLNGFSQPLVVDGRLYTAGSDMGVNQLRLYAFDAATGAQIWSSLLGASDGSGWGTLSTPSVADGEVYFFDNKGTLHCHDKSTGSQLWKKAAALEESTSYRYCGSPLVEEDLVILNSGGWGTAVRRAEPHDIVWPSGPGGRAGFSSPVAYSIGSERFAALHTEEAAVGVRLSDGAVAWTFPIGGYRTGQTPILYGDSILFMGEDCDWALLRPGTNSVSAVWTNSFRPATDISSGVIWGDYMYRPCSGGLHCFDVRDGSTQWMHPLPRDAKWDGPVIAADGKLILYWACNLYVLRATPDGYDEEGREPFFVEGSGAQGSFEWAHTAPTLAYGKLYVRQKGMLACYQVGPEPPADNNGNAIADAWEARHFPVSPCDPTGDPDNDGASNLDEYLAGTNPTNSSSFLCVSIAADQTNITVSANMTEPCGPGYEYKTRYYCLQHRSDLCNAEWQGVPGCTNRPGEDSVLCFTNSLPAGSEFYRATVRQE